MIEVSQLVVTLYWPNVLTINKLSSIKIINVQLIGGARQHKLVLRHHTVTAVRMSAGRAKTVACGRSAGRALYRRAESRMWKRDPVGPQFNCSEVPLSPYRRPHRPSSHKQSATPARAVGFFALFRVRIK
jgi:hypothetical protein